MKKTLFSCILFVTFGNYSGFEQDFQSTVSIPRPMYSQGNFIEACDTSSTVANMTSKMQVPKNSLPVAMIHNDAVRYQLKFKKKTVSFYYENHAENIMSVWINQMRKHCFKINVKYDYIFKSYLLNDKSFEIYGELRWDRFYRNFRLIFYENKEGVIFDLDDEILKQKD